MFQGSKIDPVCKVVVFGQRKQTRVHKVNANPIYNEHFTFNFHESSQKLFEQTVEFKIFNARKIFKDAMIGSFTVCPHPLLGILTSFTSLINSPSRSRRLTLVPFMMRITTSTHTPGSCSLTLTLAIPPSRDT